MKSSQVLIEAANNIAALNEECNCIHNYGCLQIQIELNMLTLASDFNSAEVEYYKLFGNPILLTYPDKVTWFDSHFSDENNYITTSELNEMRVLALCFASYIAKLEGN